MKTQREVFKKLLKEDKTELATQKIELDLVGNLRKYPKGFSKYESEGEGLVKLSERLKNELSDVKKAILKWSQVGDSITSDILNDLKKFDAKAKELGFNAEIQIDYSNARDVYDKYDDLSKKYERIAEKL